MTFNRIRCPSCHFEGSSGLFEIVDGDTLKCRRCRSRFEDPNVFAADVSYADCDSRKAVSRFPFSLNGTNSVIRVRDGYMALALGNSGTRKWFYSGVHPVNDMTEGFHLYYVCLKPQIAWGTQNPGGVGAYGTAFLTLSREYVEEYARNHEHILTMEEHLKYLVDACVTLHVQRRTEENHQGLLEQRDGYLSVLGVLEEGATVTEIRPLGFRNSSGRTGTFPALTISEEPDMEERTEIAPKVPVEDVRIPQEGYTVRTGVEDVLIRGAAKAERHKADERIEPGQLRGVSKLLRFRSKEFEFPFGWGVGNQVCGSKGFFSAYGTISFYIDSTEKMSLQLSRTEGWKDYEEQLFFNVIKPEISAAISGILEQIPDTGTGSAGLRDYLSEMSIELTNRLNGEGGAKKGPVFRQYGLRAKRADILSISISSARR